MGEQDCNNLTETQKEPIYKTMKTYVDYVMTNLGNQILKIELSEKQVEDIVNMALEELTHYMNDTKSITIPYKSVIDTSKWPYRVSVVNYVMRGQSAINYLPTEQLTAAYIYTAQTGANTGINLDSIANAVMAQQNLNTISTDLDFRFEKDEQKLFVTCNAVQPKTITVDYMPEYSNVDELTDPYWKNTLKRYSLAMTKVILGRIRSKYTLNSSQYSLDGQTILSEGLQELESIRTNLQNNNDSLFVID